MGKETRTVRKSYAPTVREADGGTERSRRCPPATHICSRTSRIGFRSPRPAPYFSVNAELIRLYWDIGRMIEDRQRQEGWGTAVIPRLARELHNELPEHKGYSERNIKRMLGFFRAYPDPSAIVPRAVAQSSGTTKCHGPWHKRTRPATPSSGQSRGGITPC